MNLSCKHLSASPRTYTYTNSQYYASYVHIVSINFLVALDSFTPSEAFKLCSLQHIPVISLYTETLACLRSLLFVIFVTNEADVTNHSIFTRGERGVGDALQNFWSGSLDCNDRWRVCAPAAHATKCTHHHHESSSEYARQIAARCKISHLWYALAESFPVGVLRRGNSNASSVARWSCG